MNKCSNIILGSVQFGLNYGINNSRGIVPKNEVFDILDLSINSGINTIDTAALYGDSELVLGEYDNLNKFNIITKSSHKKKCKQAINESLEKLKLNNIYGYLVHDFNEFKNDISIWNDFEDLKTKKIVKKIGFSVYYPEDVEFLFKNNIKFDLIQFPYSILDQRFNSILPDIKNKKIETHARSSFLQGLVFKNIDDIKTTFPSAFENIKKLNLISKKTKIPISTLCINFLMLNKDIDSVVIGVDNINNMKNNIKSLNYDEEITLLLKDLYKLKLDDLNVLIPSKWSN